MAIAEKWRGFRDLPGDLAERLRALPPLLEERGVRLAYLFGSLLEAPERASPGDVDLAVLTDGEPAERLRPALVAEHLEDAFEVFPGFAGEVLEWMDSLEEQGS